MIMAVGKSYFKDGKREGELLNMVVSGKLLSTGFLKTTHIKNRTLTYETLTHSVYYSFSWSKDVVYYCEMTNIQIDANILNLK